MRAVADLPPEGGGVQESGRPRAAGRDPEPSSAAWKELFRGLAAGDPAALEGIYRAAARHIFGLAFWRTGSAEDAADVVQEVFLRLATRHRRVGGIEDPRSWLLGVAHHVAIDLTRRRRRRAAAPIEEFPHLEAAQFDGARAIDAAHVSKLLALLPPAQRDAIYLHHYADCTFAAIGDITGVPTFTAASRYRLGIERLRRLVEEKR